MNYCHQAGYVQSVYYRQSFLRVLKQCHWQCTVVNDVRADTCSCVEVVLHRHAYNMNWRFVVKVSPQHALEYHYTEGAAELIGGMVVSCVCSMHWSCGVQMCPRHALESCFVASHLE